jgi:peptidyl-prolyl cis-trans isomerase SurA
MTNFFSNVPRILCAGSLFLIASTFAYAAPVPLDNVVAVVNNSVLTQNQLNETIESLKEETRATNAPPLSPALLRKKALDRAIGELLQLQIAQRAHITVSDAQVMTAITQIAQQNHLSIEDLKKELEKQGIQYSTYRTRIHDQMVIQRLQQEALTGKVSVTKAEVEAFLKKTPAPYNPNTLYRIEDLLVPLQDTATPEEKAAGKKQAYALLEKARAGAPFTTLVEGSLQRSDLEWRTLQDLPEIFSVSVKKLKAGEITDPIQAANGWHILHVIEIRGQAAPFTEAEAKQRLIQKKMQEAADKWTQELRASAYVKVM